MKLATLSKDIPASFVVFLVALPLSIGIALASGAPVRAGLVAAAIGGIVVGLLSGAPMQVSGPAAGLSVMVFGSVQKFGFTTTCAITMVAGLIQVAAGTAGVAQGALAISPAVLHAMLAGIGILIALGQVHVLLGDVPHGSALSNLTELPHSLANVNGAALAIGESMPCAVVTEQLHSGPRAHLNNELFAQGVGNLLSGWWRGHGGEGALRHAVA